MILTKVWFEYPRADPLRTKTLKGVLRKGSQKGRRSRRWHVKRSPELEPGWCVGRWRLRLRVGILDVWIQVREALPQVPLDVLATFVYDSSCYYRRTCTRAFSSSLCIGCMLGVSRRISKIGIQSICYICASEGPPVPTDLPIFSFCITNSVPNEFSQKQRSTHRHERHAEPRRKITVDSVFLTMVVGGEECITDMSRDL